MLGFPLTYAKLQMPSYNNIKGHLDLIFRCMVKITGNVMMSFPAGVVRVFKENPNPALLSFKIKNTSKLENTMLNRQLIEQ